MSFTEILNLTIEFKLVATIATIGWVLGVICLFVRFKPQKDRIVCLLSDLASKTFISVTFFAALSIAINIAIYLPTLARERSFKEVEQKVSSIENINDQINKQLSTLTQKDRFDGSEKL